MDFVARSLVIAGLVLLAAGLFLHFGPSVPFLGKLPGDLRIDRPGIRIYVPITSCVVLSLALSGVLWLLSKLR